MDHLEQFRQRLRNQIVAVVIATNVITVAAYYLLNKYTELPAGASIAVGLVASSLLAASAAFKVSMFATEPLQALRQAILHIQPDNTTVLAPDIDSLRAGRELVASLTSQVYQLASIAEKAADKEKAQIKDLHRNFIAENLPLPLLVLDSSETIAFANEAAAKYIGIESKDMLGKNVYMVLDMSFPNNDTFDTWLKSVKSKTATSSSAWERVRLNVRDNHPPRLFDLSAYYNRDNPDHHETMLVLFDHTTQYSQDEQAVSFIALSVHELRTPLTLLRGYIEVFEEEIDASADPELHNFMQKMHAQAEQLTAFVNNILNVARVDNDQLELKLQAEDWPTLIKSSVEMISLRAKVRGITLKCRIHHGMPPVGADRLSIREVMNNLIDNAIKYSGTSKVIEIETFLNKQGRVETHVRDHGLGVPSSILPNLFTKFYRDHHNRAQIGGTGLGLYLSKAIVGAHGGDIWVESKEGEGSDFAFTLLPYEQIADEQKHNGQEGITRAASGWIKNHSLYRQ
jgi:signal transduction histidine kinase